MVALIKELYTGNTEMMKQAPNMRVVKCAASGIGIEPVKAAIIIYGNQVDVTVDPHLIRRNIAAAVLRVGRMSLGVVSVYFEPSEHKMDPQHFLIGGDINAKSLWWGSRHDDHRGEAYFSFLDAAGLHILNEGDRPTFQVVRGGVLCTSIVDVTKRKREMKWK